MRVPRLLPRRGTLGAALLGAGSLLLSGRRWATPLALVYVGVAVGVALADAARGRAVGIGDPEAQDVLELWPARVLAIAGNTLGTLAVVVVALASLRRRPLGNALILAGVGVAAVGSALGASASGPSHRSSRPALLLYAGFVGAYGRLESSSLRRASPAGGGSSPPPRSRSRRRARRPRQEDERLDHRSGQASVGDQLRGEHPQATHRIQHHQRQHRVLGA